MTHTIDDHIRAGRDHATTVCEILSAAHGEGAARAHAAGMIAVRAYILMLIVIVWISAILMAALISPVQAQQCEIADQMRDPLWRERTAVETITLLNSAIGYVEMCKSGDCAKVPADKFTTFKDRAEKQRKIAVQIIACSKGAW